MPSHHLIRQPAVLDQALITSPEAKLLASSHFLTFHILASYTLSDIFSSSFDDAIREPNQSPRDPKESDHAALQVKRQLKTAFTQTCYCHTGANIALSLTVLGMGVAVQI